MPELRSRTSTHGRNMAGARGLWRATGMKDGDFGKPIVAVVNSFTQKDKADTAIYYDLPEYRPFWKKVSELDVPFYIHPRSPLLSKAPDGWGRFTSHDGEGHPRLGGANLGQDVAYEIDDSVFVRQPVHRPGEHQVRPMLHA